MSWAQFETLFKASCKHINESHKSFSINATNVLGTSDALLDSLANIEQDAKDAITEALKVERSSLNGIAAGWARLMDGTLAFGGTQLTIPSKWVRGNTVRNREKLLRDIQRDFTTNARNIDSRAVTYASDPSGDDDIDVQRVTVNVDNEKIEAGLHNQTLDVEVIGGKTTGLGEWATEIEIRPRNEGQDIYQLLAPLGSLKMRAVSDVFNPDGVIANSNLNAGINSQTDGVAVTALNNWTLSNPLNTPTHLVDTTNNFRSLVLGHKIFGTTATRRFSQNLNLRKNKRNFPHGIRIPVFKSGSPTGNIVITWGSKTETFTMASLSAGWNFLTIARDSDMYVDNFDTGTAVIQIDIECTTGSSSAYITLGGIYGQVAKVWNANYYFAWSRDGKSQIGVKKVYADTMTTAGKNATALYLAYHGTNERDHAWFPNDGTPTLADYT